jgi:S-adenosylmethionine:tRNA ribosyltransferase-isomerase
LSIFQLSDYDYELDEGRIAQIPAAQRDHSRLMVLERETGKYRHRRFYEISEFLAPGDLLVFNDTKVFPARLIGSKETGGRVEVFLLRDLGENRWEVLIRGRVSEGAVILLEEEGRGTVEETLDDGKRVVRFTISGGLWAYLERNGRVPLPPYIRRNGNERLSDLDRQRYQTVYSKRPGAVASPTAGLHFTEELLATLRDQGVHTAFLTLHVGYGTFKPVQSGDIRAHRMDREWYSIEEQTAAQVNKTLREGKRVIAVGTTTTRALESAEDDSGTVPAGASSTNLFITPGRSFRVIGGLITNFHLPRSTLLMLVAAFAGKDRIDRAYREAIERGYRFYSYGDAMMIL